MSHSLIYPMTFYVFYIFAIGVFLFLSRVKAIKNREVSIKHFRTYAGTPPSEKNVALARHYDNQFQLPMLFFVGALAHLVVGPANSVTLILAWAFVVARMMHSWIHLGSNNVNHRAMSFALAWIIVLLIWGQLLLFKLLEA